jgi:cytochrome oxidase Cu insertion factor (SCO1/SenC/PrrC family)
MPAVLGRTLAVVAAAVLLAGIALVPLTQAAPSGPAPAFTLDLFNGKKLSLADVKGTAIVLLFWANW